VRWEPEKESSGGHFANDEAKTIMTIDFFDDGKKKLPISFISLQRVGITILVGTIDRLRM
jgi:hypothetical protein